jgi:Rha family phage regulatory protein
LIEGREGGSHTTPARGKLPADCRSVSNLPAALRLVARRNASECKAFEVFLQERFMSQSAQAATGAISLTVIDGQATTTSNEVARHFGKQHKDVLEKIAALSQEVDPAFSERNFPPSEYTDSTGRTLPAYRITRDGFTLLAMGFTGKKALAFKLAYIEAFNRMEAALHHRSPATEAAAMAIDPRALLLSGQSALRTTLPPEVARAIDAQAWDMAREAFDLSRQHLVRKVAHQAEYGLPPSVKTREAIKVVRATTPGNALAHAHHTQRRGAVTSLNSMARILTEQAQRVAQEMAALDAQAAGERA